MEWANFSTQAVILWHKVHELWSQSDIEDVKEAVRHEMDGPSQLLDYRFMQQKVRENHLGHNLQYSNSRHHCSILFCVEVFAYHKIAMVFMSRDRHSTRVA